LAEAANTSPNLKSMRTRDGDTACLKGVNAVERNAD